MRHPALMEQACPEQVKAGSRVYDGTSPIMEYISPVRFGSGRKSNGKRETA